MTGWKVPDAPSSGPPMTMPPAGPPPRASKSRHAVEVDVHASVGIVRPGDKLVIAAARTLDEATADRLRQQIEGRLPGVEAVIIEAGSLVVYRGER